MTLQEALSAIEAAVYGEDVRNAILSGLELCYTERLSGGYDIYDDANDQINGIALFDAGAANRPFDSPFLLIAGGDDDDGCQLAIDPAGSFSKMIRQKENGTWTEWVSVVETLMYQVRYFSYDGSELLYTEKVTENHDASWNGTPEKTSTAQYDYIFLGWNLLPNQSAISEGALNNLQASVDVYAAYNPTPRAYTVSFYNGSTLFDTASVTYGNDAPQPSATPQKASSAQYNYTFIGWSTSASASAADANALKNITSDRSVYAIYSSSVRSYTVSFRNGSTELQSVSVSYGGTAVYSGATPTKESTEQYNYSFVGWSTVDGASTAEANATKNITSDKILYAAFSSSVLAYTVRFLNGAEVLETLSVEYGNDASYSGTTPTKDLTVQYTYSFLGWSTDPNATSASAAATRNITADRDIYAVYRQTLRSYTVTFMNGDTLMGTKSVSYGNSTSYSGDTPTKPSSAQYNYTFAGWSRTSGATTVESDALQNITGDRTVYAVFSTSVRSYTVRFIDNGTVLDIQTIAYGNDVTYAGTNPTREATAQYTYSFVGWNSAPNQTVKDDSVLQNITANRDIYAAYSQTLRSYSVRFYNGSELMDTQTVDYGSAAVYGGTTPTKGASSDYIYAFVGWNSLPEQETAESGVLDSITGDLDVYAAFQYVPRYYTVRFYYDSSLLDTQTVEYGDTAVYGGTIPSKQSVAQYDYTFNGWNTAENQTAGIDGILENITQNLDLYAAFLPVERTFTVRFINGSTVLQESQVAYGSNAVYSGATPTKASTAQYNYSFVGWALQDGQSTADFSALIDITADRDIFAAFSSTVRTYTVRFMNGTTVLQTVSVTYGGTATYTGTKPVHPTEPNSYDFFGWDPDRTNITADTDCQPVWVFARHAARGLISRTLSGSYENSEAASVGEYAFANCVDLTSVSLPNVSSIGANAFANCTNLSTAVIGTGYSGVCTLANSNAFTGTASNLKIYVQDNYYASYQTAAQWSAIASRIYSASDMPGD